ncbi:MAG: hypothetical protein M0Z42_19370 [Actinomycetota bacterium]|nr:hypothetical protein [Actinomycetota bacterium]
MTFDDTHAVAHAGLALVGTLSEHLGLEAVVDEHVDLAGRPGYFRPGRKVATLVHAVVPTASTTPTCCGREQRERCWLTG